MLILAIPILLISTDHELFFILASTIVTITSASFIAASVSGTDLHINEEDDDLQEELEDLMNIDMKKLGTGFSILYNMLNILLLCYCSFYLKSVIFKVIISTAVILQIFFIRKKYKENTPDLDQKLIKPQMFTANVINITIILFTVINKLYRFK
jgi:hypothetical protein